MMVGVSTSVFRVRGALVLLNIDNILWITWETRQKVNLGSPKACTSAGVRGRSSFILMNCVEYNGSNIFNPIFQEQAVELLHNLGTFGSQQINAMSVHARYSELQRTRAQSIDAVCCSSPSSSGCSDSAELLMVKIALGKGIRDLAETNHQLSSALAGEEQVDGNTLNELVSRVEQLLATQNNCLYQICRFE